jgi:hypothetical protein
MEQLLEWSLVGEIEVLGENIPQCHFDHHKSHIIWPGLQPGNPAINRPSYGTAHHRMLHGYRTLFGCCTARVFSRDSPWKVAQWTGRPIRESWAVLWLAIRLLSVRAYVSSSVRSILPCTERLYCIPLHTCQHAGALPAITNTSPTLRRRTVRTKYYYCTLPSFVLLLFTCRMNILCNESLQVSPSQ